MVKRQGGLPRVALALALALAPLWAAPADARTCCSKLATHLWEATDTLEIGAEPRAFYFGAHVGGGLPSSSASAGEVFEHNLFLGLRPLVNWFPLDKLSFTFEAGLRYKNPGWKENPIPGFSPRLLQALVAYDTSLVSITAGIQAQVFGNAAVLDQRFLGLNLDHKNDWVSLSLFGGLFARHLMRNAADCYWMRYASDTIGWKTVSSAPLQNRMAGVIVGVRKVKPAQLKLLYLYVQPSVAYLESHVWSVSLTGPLWQPYIRFDFEVLAQLKEGGSFLPAAVALLTSRFGKTGKAPRLTVGAANSFGETEERRLAPVLENLSWGMVRRFTLFDGHIFTAQARWPLHEHIKPFADYFFQTPDSSFDHPNDELDLGAWVQINDRYRLRLAYVGMNLAGDFSPSHAFYAELRLIVGS